MVFSTPLPTTPGISLHQLSLLLLQLPLHRYYNYTNTINTPLIFTPLHRYYNYTNTSYTPLIFIPLHRYYNYPNTNYNNDYITNYINNYVSGNTTTLTNNPYLSIADTVLSANYVEENAYKSSSQARELPPGS